MARAFQKRVDDCLRVRKELHNILWSVNDRHADGTSDLTRDFRRGDRTAFAQNIAEMNYTSFRQPVWQPIACPVKRRMIGGMRVLCVLDYESLLALYVLDQLDRAIRTAKIVCYVAKMTKKKRFQTNGRPIVLVLCRMRQRTVCSCTEERKVQAFRSPCVQTSVLYDERSSEACTDLKNQRHVHLSERSLVPSCKSYDSCDSPRPFFRVFS